MKNISKIGLSALFVSVLVLAGCGNKNAGSPATPDQNSPAPDSSQSLSETVKQGIYDLVSKGTGVKCTIEDPKMGQLTMFAKGEKAKMEGFPYMGSPMNASADQPPKEEKGTMVNDGTWVYMWNGAEGMKFNVEEMKELAAQNQSQSGDQSQENASNWKDWVKKMDAEGTKYDCSPAVISDSDFAPPSDVQFQDWGEMMKGFVKMGEEMKNNMPTPPVQ